MEKVNLTSIAEVKLSYKSKVKPSDRPKVNSSLEAYELFKLYWDFNKDLKRYHQIELYDTTLLSC